MRFLTLIILFGLFWFNCFKPLLAEVQYHKFQQALKAQRIHAADKYILKALSYSPGNTIMAVHAGQLYANSFDNHRVAIKFYERAIQHMNGDATAYSVYFLRGLSELNRNDVKNAKASFEKVLEFHPRFENAKRLLEVINQRQKKMK